MFFHLKHENKRLHVVDNWADQGVLPDQVAVVERRGPATAYLWNTWYYGQTELWHVVHPVLNNMGIFIMGHFVRLPQKYTLY